MAILHKIFINIILFSCVVLAQQPGVAFISSHDLGVADTSTNIYVDAQNGSDNNSGLTWALAKQSPDSALILVNASTDTVFITGTFDNPIPIWANCGVVLTAVFYSELLDDYTYVAGSTGGSVTDTYTSLESYDDVWRYGTGSGFYPAYDYGDLGNTSGASQQMAFRFRNITERPAIDSAKIRLHPKTTAPDDNVNITIGGEESANPDTISTRYSFDYRKTNLTTASYAYTMRHWTIDVPDTLTVTNIISELFTSYSYAGSQSLVLFLLNNSSTTDAIRKLKTFENGDSIPELLVYSSSAAQNAYYWKLYTEEVTAVYFGTELGTEETDKSLLDAVKEWCWSNDTLYVYGEALPPSGSTVYNVTPWGGGDTLSTIAEVNALTIVAGDTVAFLPPYTYTGQLIPKNNGVYTSFGANGRYKLKHTVATNEDYVVDADSTSNVILRNAEIIGRNWITADGSYNNIFRQLHCYHESTTDDNYMPSDGRGVFRCVYTPNARITIDSSIFIGGFPQTGTASDMIYLWGTGYIDLKDNLLKNTSHSLTAFGNGSHHVRYRGNRVYNQFHHGLFLFTGGSMEHDFIVDYNLFERSGNGQAGTNNPVQYNGEIGEFGMDSYSSIFRYNVVKRMGVPRRKWNNAGGAQISSDSRDVRIYNNVFDYPYETFCFRITLDDGNTQLQNITAFNNALTRGGDTSWVRFYGVYADTTQLILWDDNSTYNPSNINFNYNYFGSDGNNLYNYIASDLETTNTTAWTGYTFANNIDSYYAYSVFDAPDDSVLNYTYWIPQTVRGNLYDSVLAKYNGKTPLIDAGRPHTYISGTVNNDTILVTDSRVFFDGWNWLEGDSLLIDTFRVQVIGINYTTNYIALSGIVNVLDNTPVYLINPYTHDAYKESAIDIGLE